MSLATFARRVFCRHRNVRFVRNIHGDEINTTGKRSVWTCQACSAVVLRADLHPLPPVPPRIPPAPPMPPRRVYADEAPAPSQPAAVVSINDQPVSVYGLPSRHTEEPEPARFFSGGGGDFSGGGASGSWGDSPSSCDSSSHNSSDSGSSSSDSSSSSCSSD